MNLDIKVFDDAHVVIWNENKLLREWMPGLNLCDIVFGQMKCEEMTLLEFSDDKKIWCLTWIKDMVWASDKTNSYGGWLERSFKISGVGFGVKEHAQDFKNTLEKIVVWRELKR